ncbi:MAG: hypothetical protein HY974_01410 [Candidatus Kerfeldbacteria bacterium]|nr:hypothetical protein [Candidatus Kerfeldbacteria bacterium]
MVNDLIERFVGNTKAGPEVVALLRQALSNGQYDEQISYSSPASKKEQTISIRKLLHSGREAFGQLAGRKVGGHDKAIQHQQKSVNIQTLIDRIG